MPAPSLDGETIINEVVSATSSWTSATNKTTAGSNRVAFLVLVGQTFGSVGGSSATFNGAGMTLLWEIKHATDNQYSLCFYYLNPPTGASAVTATLSGSFYGMANVFSFKDVNQSAPFGTAVTAYGSTGTATVDVTSAAGETVIDGKGSYNSDPAVGSGQTQISENNDSGTTWGNTSYEAGAGTVTMSWTSVGTRWAIGGVGVKPAASGNPWYEYAKQAA